MLGKWKATVQFVALGLAMIRPDVMIAGAISRPMADGDRGGHHRVVGIDYLVRSSDALRSAPS